MGNFNIQKPTDAQLQALLALTTALAKKYKIDPMGKVTYFRKSDWPPYMSAVQGYAIAGHRDVSNATACPGTNMIALLPTLRQRVKDALLSSPSSIAASVPTSGSQLITFTGLHYLTSTTIALPLRFSLTRPVCTNLLSGSTVSLCVFKKNTLFVTFSSKDLSSGIKYISLRGTLGKQNITKLLSFSLLRKGSLASEGKKIATLYAKNSAIVPSSSSLKKISAKILPGEIATYLKGFVSVLLYDLSINSHRWELACDGNCKVNIDGQTRLMDTITLESNDDFLYVPNGENYMTPQRVEISSASGGLVQVLSYPRNSYGKVPRNTFHGSLVFKKNPIKYLSS
ncbi:MAG: N-acetylmuramoyl-L-alanine amidase [bacterium]